MLHDISGQARDDLATHAAATVIWTGNVLDLDINWPRLASATVALPRATADTLQ